MLLSEAMHPTMEATTRHHHSSLIWDNVLLFAWKVWGEQRKGGRISFALTENQAVHQTYSHQVFILHTVQNRTAAVWEEIQWCTWAVPAGKWDGIVTCSCASTLTRQNCFWYAVSVTVVKTEFANIMTHKWFSLTKYSALIAQSVY